MSVTNGRDTTNPGLVNVADQGFDFLPNPDQAVVVSEFGPHGVVLPPITGILSKSVSEVTNPDLVDVADQGFGRGIPRNVNVG